MIHPSSGVGEEEGGDKTKRIGRWLSFGTITLTAGRPLAESLRSRRRRSTNLNYAVLLSSPRSLRRRQPRRHFH